MTFVTRLFTAMVAAAAIVSCSNIKIHTDYDPGADLSTLGSYAWLPGPRPPTGDPRIDNSLLDARVRHAVDTQLAARGYLEASPDEADFLVTYHAALETKLDIDPISRSYGYGGGPWYGYGGVGSETIVREYEQGTLLLDFIDPKTRQLLWRGSASAKIRSSNSPEESQKRVNQAVAAMLERFPPR